MTAIKKGGRMVLIIYAAVICFISAGILAGICIKNFIDLDKANRQMQKDAATIARLKRLLRGGEGDGA